MLCRQPPRQRGVLMSADDDDDISTESVKGTYTGLYDCETVDIRRTPENLDDLPSSVAGACCAYPVIVGDLNCAQTRFSTTSQCGGHRRCAQAMMSRFWLVTLLCVCVGVLLQIAANYANDYSDGIRGVDEGRGGSEKKTKKPMRLTASGLVPAKHVLVAAVVSALLACVCGLAAVVLSQAWWLLLVGACSPAGRLVIHRRQASVRICGIRRTLGVPVLRFGRRAWALCAERFGQRARRVVRGRRGAVVMPDTDGEQPA